MTVNSYKCGVCKNVDSVPIGKKCDGCGRQGTRAPKTVDTSTRPRPRPKAFTHDACPSCESVTPVTLSAGGRPMCDMCGFIHDSVRGSEGSVHNAELLEN